MEKWPHKAGRRDIHRWSSAPSPLLLAIGLTLICLARSPAQTVKEPVSQPRAQSPIQQSAPTFSLSGMLAGAALARFDYHLRALLQPPLHPRAHLLASRRTRPHPRRRDLGQRLRRCRPSSPTRPPTLRPTSSPTAAGSASRPPASRPASASRSSASARRRSSAP